MKHPARYFDLYYTGSSRRIPGDLPSRTIWRFIPGSSGMSDLCYGGGLNPEMAVALSPITLQSRFRLRRRRSEHGR
mgnify:FL=1